MKFQLVLDFLEINLISFEIPQGFLTNPSYYQKALNLLIPRELNEERNIVLQKSEL